MEPHHDRDKVVATCIGYFKANSKRLRCDGCRKRGLPVGSGVAECACKQIVWSRFKQAGRRWAKAGTDARLTAECCIENNRWADFIEWRACRVTSA